jgi:hypothetical protein
MDPSKSITIRTSIDVPSFPRSKWDSENEMSDNDNVFEKSQEENVLISERNLTESTTESESESQKSLPQLEAQPQLDPELQQPLPQSVPQPKPELRELKQTSAEHRK